MLRLLLLVLVFAIVLVVACGGGDDSTAPAPEDVIVGTADPSEAPSFTVEEIEVLIEVAQDANREYGFAAACLFHGDFTRDGWDISLVTELAEALELPPTMDASGAVGSTADGNSYLSFYDSHYDGAAVELLEKVETDDQICYSPVLP